MSQTTEAQTTPPTSEEVIGKVNESIAALQEAQKTVVEGAQLLAEHVNDPTAHGAAIPEVVEQQLPTPVMEGTSLKWEKKDGTIVAGPVDLKGAPGQDGADGETGPRPEHRWEGTKLFMQNSDGSWPAEGVDLKGDKGDTGKVEGLSDSVDSDNSTTPASSKAVKTAYDKAVSAQETADAANSTAQAAQSAAETADSKAQAAQNAAQAAQTTAENIGIFSGSTSGLVPASDGDATKVLLGDGTWGSAVSADDGAAVMTISEDLHLTADSPRSLVLAATTSGLSVYLPDHATLQRGSTFHIWVRPLEDIQLKDFSGEVVKAYPSLAVSSVYLLQLVDTEAGVWALAEYKSGATSDATAVPGLNAGELKVFNSGTTSGISVTSLSATKALVCYINANSCGTACVLDVSGTTITAGEEKIFNSHETHSVSVTALSEAQALVVFSATQSGKTHVVQLNVLSISGTTISLGGNRQITFGESHSVSVTALSETKAIVCYMYEGVGTCYANILSISWTDVSTGEKASINSGNTSNINVTPLSETKVLVCYVDVTHSNIGKARVLDISGTTISVGEEKIFNSGGTSNISITALSATKALVCYTDVSNSNKGTACILNVSGTDVTIASRIVFNSGATSSISVTALSATKALVCYADTSNSNYCKACVLNISGTTISVGEEKLINYESTSCISVSQMCATFNCVVAFNSNNELGAAGIITL